MPSSRRLRRRRLSLTSLIDVIFLLLLFFMLSSTFSRFAEVELTAAGQGSATEAPTDMIFLRLGAQTLDVNGTSAALPELTQTVRAQMQAETANALVSVGAEVDAQRLTDLLVVLRSIAGLDVTVMSPA